MSVVYVVGGRGCYEVYGGRGGVRSGDTLVVLADLAGGTVGVGAAIDGCGYELVAAVVVSVLALVVRLVEALRIVGGITLIGADT